MRAILGAIVGMLVATAVVAVLGSVLERRAFIATLVAGLACGVLMRLVASGSCSVYLRGGLAAAVTAAAAVVGPIAAAQWYGAMTDRLQPRPEAGAVAAQGPSDGSSEDSSGASDLELPVTPAARAPGLRELSPLGGGQDPVAADTFLLELASMVIGCLVAYQVGKGAPASAAAPAVDSPETAAGSGADQLAESADLSDDHES